MQIPPITLLLIVSKDNLFIGQIYDLHVPYSPFISKIINTPSLYIFSYKFTISITNVLSIFNLSQSFKFQILIILYCSCEDLNNHLVNFGAEIFFKQQVLTSIF